MLIDSHCHLDFDVLYSDLPGVFERMQAANVVGCVTISTWVKEYDVLAKIAQEQKNVWFSIGTHPCNAAEEPDIQASELVKLSAHEKCVAIGEAGLDYFHNPQTSDVQKASFRQHIAAARQTGLPLIIHARNADKDIEAILRDESEQGAFPFVLHCFSSGAALAKAGLELGGYLSFSGIVTFNSAKDILEIARACPGDRILVETDAPYLAPVPNRGKPNQPAFVRHTSDHIAKTRGVEIEEFDRLTTENFFRLFSKARLA